MTKLITTKKADYSSVELAQLKRLANAKGGKVFKNSQAAKDYLSSL